MLKCVWHCLPQADIIFTNAITKTRLSYLNQISQLGREEYPESNILTKICSDCPGQCMFQAIHNDDQTEGHNYHNHDNALLAEAAD